MRQARVSRTSRLFKEHVIKPMLGLGAADANEVRRGEQLMREYGGVLDAHLSGRDWICGDALSLADIAIAVPLAATVPARLPVGDLSNVQRWLTAMQTLEAWKRTALP